MWFEDAVVRLAPTEINGSENEESDQESVETFWKHRTPQQRHKEELHSKAVMARVNARYKAALKEAMVQWETSCKLKENKGTEEVLQ